MPDRHGFDHLVDHGRVSHRCIEDGCGWPGFDVAVSEREREKHAAQHLRQRKRDRERAQRASAAHARSMQRLAERENRQAYR